MNRSQWFVLGFGLIILGYILMKFAMSCVGLDDAALIACYIQRYSYGVPALISIALGVLFFIMGSLESTETTIPTTDTYNKPRKRK